MKPECFNEVNYIRWESFEYGFKEFKIAGIIRSYLQTHFGIQDEERRHRYMYKNLRNVKTAYKMRLKRKN